MTSLLVICRTCDKINAFSGRPREFGTKKEVIRKCITSLGKSIAHARTNATTPVDLIFVDDHSSKETLDLLEYWSCDDIVSMNATGNGESLTWCYDIAKLHKGQHDLIFFCEDDYLLESTTIDEMVDIYERGKNIFGKSVAVHPVDYPDRYQKLYPSYILLGKNRHWRTIQHTTGTVMVDRDTLLEHWDHFQKFTRYGIEPGVNEDTSINQIYNTVPCLSPIPSLGHHLQYKSTLSPFLEIDDEHNLSSSRD
ncbi:MAG: hypothetical protein ACXABY_08625 [Candidatus Thorarchaeota archaeon]|jgi:glycosyltransferase involved in cell wall biosynthesis